VGEHPPLPAEVGVLLVVHVSPLHLSRPPPARAPCRRTQAPRCRAREEVEIRKMDRLLALSDAKITIVTPIPGQEKKKGGAAAAAAGAEDGAAEAAAHAADA